MQNTKNTHYFLLICVAASLIVVFVIIHPFLGPLFLAGVAAFIFQPLYRKMLVLTRQRVALSALLTTVIATVLIMVPIALIGTQIFIEASDLYNSFANGNNRSVLIEALEDIAQRVAIVFPLVDVSTLDFGQYVKQGLEALVQNLGSIFSSVAKLLLNIFVFLISFYFLLKDGRALKDYLVKLSPLDDQDDERIVSRLRLSVSAVVKGNLSIGLIQGVLTGIGFTIFGVPNAVLWGTVAAVSALIPGVGTALVISPAILFLFGTGHMASALGLLLWGIIAVGMVDNLLGPRLVGKGMQLHPLLVFLAVLGGLAFFGPLGFLLGPLTLSLCLALIDIYFSLKAKSLA